MGYFGRLEDKIKAQNLRRQGLSYREILIHVKASKDSISRWCKNIKLTELQKTKLLKNKQFGQRKGSLIAAENKRMARLLRTKNIYNQALINLGQLNQRDIYLIGLALYAGEGNKYDGHIGFSNADPNLILFMMKWFKLSFNIPLNKFRGGLWLHDNLDEDEAKTYWSKLTGIPLQQFHKTYIVKNKIDSKKIRKNIHSYGVFTIIISDSNIHRKIMGWISAVFNAKIPSRSPVAQW